MTGPPRPDGSSPLDKLSKDVSQYRHTHAAGKPVVRAAVRVAQPQPPAQPGRAEPRRIPLSQAVVPLLIAGYVMLMLAGSLAVVVFAPSACPALWPVMAIGVIVAMIAHYRGRPPLLWFLYGSILPMAPLVQAVLMGKAAVLAVSAGRGEDSLGLGQMQALLGATQASSGSVMELFALVCVLGAVPLVHALLAPRNQAVLEARQLAAGMRKCPFCAEMIKQDAKVCRWCGKETADKVTA
jgi:hypothetical protein